MKSLIKSGIIHRLSTPIHTLSTYFVL